MKTIKQMADEIGVSKQKVYRFIVKNHITASSEAKQSKLYDEAIVCFFMFNSFNFTPVHKKVSKDLVMSIREN